MAGRVQIPFSFNYPNPTNLGPVVGTAVTMMTRGLTSPIPGTPIPAVVYQGEQGASTYASLTTDASGIVPGWVAEGSYTITAAAQASFTGAVINWEAVRGDGTASLAAGAVDVAQLVAAAAQALVPSGTIYDFAGTAAPTGFLMCDASVYAQATYPALFGIIGSTYNTGGEGGGNFRVPDGRQRFTLGKSVSGTGSVLGQVGGTIDHTHSIPAMSIPGQSIPALSVNSSSIPVLQVNSHTHPLGGSGGAALRASSGSLLLTVDGLGTGPSFYSDGYAYAYGTANNSGAGSPQTSYPLTGTTELAAPTTQGSVTGGTNTVASATIANATTPSNTQPQSPTSLDNPPYLALNKIIKF